MADTYCRHCRAALPAGSRFCLKCGTPVLPGTPSPPNRPGKTPGWWGRRGRGQKAGLIVGAVFVVLVAIGVAVGNQGTGSGSSSTTSTTLGETAASVSESIVDTGTDASVSTTTAVDATTTSEETTTSLPAGPAKVVAALPSPVSLEDEGSGKSQWDYTVTFTEENGVPATIQRIGERYTDKKGNVWIGENGEWFDDSISIDGAGTAQYSSFAFSTNGGKGDLRGGLVQVSYTGIDANGNKFQGKVTATLAPTATVTTTQ